MTTMLTSQLAYATGRICGYTLVWKVSWVNKLLPIILPFGAIAMTLAIGFSFGFLFLEVTDSVSANATLVVATAMTIIIMAGAILLSVKGGDDTSERPRTGSSKSR